MENIEELTAFVESNITETTKMLLNKTIDMIDKVIFISLINGDEYVGKLKIESDKILVVEYPYQIIPQYFLDPTDEDAIESVTYSLERAFKHSKNRIVFFKHEQIVMCGEAEEEIIMAYLPLHKEESKAYRINYDSNGEARPSPSARIAELVKEGKIINLQDFIGTKQ